MLLLTLSLLALFLLVLINTYVFFFRSRVYRNFVDLGFSAELQLPPMDENITAFMNGDLLLHVNTALPNDHNLLVTELVISPRVRLAANIDEMYILANQMQTLSIALRISTDMLDQQCKNGFEIIIGGHLRKNGLVKQQFKGTVHLPFQRPTTSFLSSEIEVKDLIDVLPVIA